MTRISEIEFAKICVGINKDADSIYKHNPVGTREETLLWMLMNSLVMYLSVPEIETPCFKGMPDADTYRDAVRFIMKDRREGDFDIMPYLDAMLITDDN